MRSKILEFYATIHNFGIFKAQINNEVMKRFFASLILTLSIISCSLDDGNASDFIIETLPIKSAVVPEAFTFGNNHAITVRYDLPSSCHAFYDLYYQYEGTSRIVAVNSLIDESVACTDDVREFEYTFEVSVVQEEDYTFKFWKGTDEDGENIFEEIIVPVNE